MPPCHEDHCTDAQHYEVKDRVQGGCSYLLYGKGLLAHLEGYDRVSRVKELFDNPCNGIDDDNDPDHLQGRGC